MSSEDRSPLVWHSLLVWVFLAIMYLWPPIWKMRWEINRRKRRLQRANTA
jgi:hypothetical protein